ncbi:MAG TPA: DUF6807 family protein [Opitutus sp.]|nr:DUF6807 family protein [Opitutus sp.]
MKTNFGRFVVAMLVIAMGLVSVRAAWQRDDGSLAWTKDGRVVWRFSFDPAKGKPFFHPVTVAGGPSLTNFQPKDHPWHYGLWFSWKYINGANYWEENRETGRAQGATRWSAPEIATRDDGGATIRMELRYVHPGGAVDMTEKRTLAISAPANDGSYAIEWTADFTAGEAGAVLNRTPMPGEPDGQVNGGYAGLSARLASVPFTMDVVTPDGPVKNFEHDRARPAAAAVGCNLSENGESVGAIAILSDPANIGEKAPWYLINAANGFRFACAAVLAPRIRTLPPAAKWALHYRIAVQPEAWTPESLGAAVAKWSGEGAAAKAH